MRSQLLSRVGSGLPARPPRLQRAWQQGTPSREGRPPPRHPPPQNATRILELRTAQPGGARPAEARRQSRPGPPPPGQAGRGAPPSMNGSPRLLSPRLGGSLWSGATPRPPRCLRTGARLSGRRPAGRREERDPPGPRRGLEGAAAPAAPTREGREGGSQAEALSRLSQTRRAPFVQRLAAPTRRLQPGPHEGPRLRNAAPRLPLPPPPPTSGRSPAAAPAGKPVPPRRGKGRRGVGRLRPAEARKGVPSAPGAARREPPAPARSADPPRRGRARLPGQPPATATPAGREERGRGDLPRRAAGGREGGRMHPRGDARGQQPGPPL